MKLDYNFYDKSLCETALTHSSYANEHKSEGVHSNERLEFLGDAVLGLICGQYLYENCKRMEEGGLSKMRAAIVCEQSLYELALELDLGADIRLGRGEDCNGGRERASVLSDGVEAMLAAIYLDGGMDKARAFILPFIARELSRHMANENRVQDYKTALQEIVQKNKEEVLTYRLKSESGPDHDKWFEVEILINSNIIALGKGRSKKLAEQDGAKTALELMGQCT